MHIDGGNVVGHWVVSELEVGSSRVTLSRDLAICFALRADGYNVVALTKIPLGYLDREVGEVGTERLALEMNQFSASNRQGSWLCSRPSLGGLN